MIRRLVEELERTQLELQELRHDMLEEKKKNKNFQNLLEEMVVPIASSTNIREQRQNSKKKA
jgi:hypothetical protein